MVVRIYRDNDVDLALLKGKTCAVIGFGAQGHAHALNLRDSGMRVVVGLYHGSKSRSRAKRNRLKVFETADAVRRGDIIFLALPDTKMPAVYKKEIAPNLRAGQTVLFAHGFAIYYRTIVPRKDVDVVMVAPKGLGPMVRSEFVNGRGVPGLIAVYRNRSGRAKRIALAWAKAIGCTRAGVIETLIRAGFDTLVKAGYPPELAYFECLHELKFIVDLIHGAGMSGMRALISDTAKWGELTVGSRIIDSAVQKQMRVVLRDIRSGKFAREFIREMRTGRKRYQKLRKAADNHRIEKVGRKLRALMAWKQSSVPA
jgi:ketol-acid reductoisomerase